MVFAHHSLRETGVVLPCAKFSPAEPPTPDEPVRCLLLRHPSVVAFVTGHEHDNRVDPVQGAPGEHGFWEITPRRTSTGRSRRASSTSSTTATARRRSSGRSSTTRPPPSRAAAQRATASSGSPRSRASWRSTTIRPVTARTGTAGARPARRPQRRADRHEPLALSYLECQQPLDRVPKRATVPSASVLALPPPECQIPLIGGHSA